MAIYCLIAVALERETPRLWTWLDTAAYAFVFAMLIIRLGCALAHDHVGIRTSSWLGVRFPDGTRYDLAVLEVLCLARLAALVYIVGRFWTASEALLSGLIAAIYGSCRFAIDAFKENAITFHALTLQQGCSVALIGVSLLAFIAVKHNNSTSHRI